MDLSTPGAKGHFHDREVPYVSHHTLKEGHLGHYSSKGGHHQTRQQLCYGQFNSSASASDFMQK